MSARSRLNALLRTSTGLEIRRCVAESTKARQVFNEDGLQANKTVEMFADPRFERAYDRAIKAAGWDYGIRWRTYIALWVAEQALRVPGDYVELGVGRGWMFSAICEYVNIDETKKSVFLLDRFSDDAVDPISGEATGDLNPHSPFYARSIEEPQRKFNEWKSVELIQGDLPESLTELHGRQVALLHIDLNAVHPEVESLRVLWPQISNGGFVLLDDYAFPGHIEQFRALNKLAADIGFTIAALPTGQGLIIK